MKCGTVIYMGNFELPDKNAAAHRVVNNGKIFRSLGFRVVYLGAVRGESFEGARPSGDGVFEQAYPVGLPAWLRHVFDVSDLMKIAAKYDDLKAVILYNTPFATAKRVKKAFAGTSVTVAYDCTEWNGYAEGSIVKRLYKKLDERRIRRHLPRVCSDIVVISRRMEKAYRGANVLRLPPLVDTEDAIWHQERIEHPGLFEFLFAGSPSNKEALDVVVSAFSSIEGENLRLSVLGVTAEEFAAAFPGAQGANDSRVKFFGQLPHEEAVRRVLSCDCYVFIRESTSRNEAGFPTKFAEAYTCGVPIVTTAVSDVRDYMTSKEKGVVAKNADVPSAREAMLAVLSRPSDGEKTLDAAFDFRKYISETEKWISRAETRSTPNN